MSGDSTSSADSSKTARPSLLRPPAAITFSPPSPIESQHPHGIFHSPPQPPRTSPSEDEEVYDSPDEDAPSRDEHKRHLSVSNEMGSAPVVADQMSSSPRGEPSLLYPHAPSPKGSPGASGSSTPLRSPSPSSPRYRPRPLGHRRYSSTHRVRETMDGQQRSTDDGHRMVNQYKIGRSLGKGAYATVELAVDVGTGTEYAIKEFSQSRLHLQALQEKQRQNQRQLKRRPGAGSRQPSSEGDGKRKAGEEQQGRGGSVVVQGRLGPWGGTETVETDPLGLIRREIAVMKKVDHPNVVQLYGAISVPSADALFLVLEYISGGVLMDVKMGVQAKDVKPPFPIDQTREYFRQLCLGLEYLHANEVIHRDIKPDNILLSADKQVVKLCDFGVSEMFTAEGDDRIKKSGGSPAFLSPESFNAHVHDVHGKALDIWALGVTLYCLLTGGLPFSVDNPMELFQVVRTAEPEIDPKWEDSLKDLIKRMLNKDPEKRIIMSDIREHAWVTDNGAEPMIPTDDNLHYLGSKVEEPTQEELGNAIGSLKGVFTVIRAVQKMKRLQLHRRSLSSQSNTGSGDPQHSTDPSMTSGSMDSYASNALSLTSGSEHKWSGPTESDVTSPGEMDSPSPGTERQETNPFDRFRKVAYEVKNTGGHVGKKDKDSGEESQEAGGELQMVDSPTSDDGATLAPSPEHSS